MSEISAGLVGSISSSSHSTFSGKSGKIPSRNQPIPPPGTSARKAYDKTVREGTDRPKTTTERLTGTYNYPAKIFDSDGSKPSPPKRKRPSGDSSGGPSGGPHTSAKKSWDYYEAPLAEKYGFGKATAYQEALANTSYRREMEDMRKAGLNPSVIYGSHNSTGADSNIFPREDSSGGSGRSGGSGGSGRRHGGKRSGNYAFSGGAYYGIMAATALLTTAVTKNVGAGMAASGMVGTALKAINGFLKK